MSPPRSRPARANHPPRLDGIAVALVLNILGRTAPLAAEPRLAWHDRFSAAGVNGPVFAIQVHEESLVVGGRFTEAGGKTAPGVARWDGSTWSGMAQGLEGVVRALVHAADGTLIAGGDLVGEIGSSLARWDGELWRRDGSPVHGEVRALVRVDGRVHAGGVNLRAGTSETPLLARASGGWVPAIPGLEGDVMALAASETELALGGALFVDGSAVSVALWDGDRLRVPRPQPDAPVTALAWTREGLVAGGWFTAGGTEPLAHLARLEVGGWIAMGVGLSDWCTSLVVLEDGSLLSTRFEMATDARLPTCLRWDRDQWRSIAWTDRTVHTVTTYGGELVIGGDFRSVGAHRISYVAIGGAGAWRSLGGLGGPDGVVYALASRADEIFVGGEFRVAGDVDARNVAELRGSAWQSLGSGTDGFVKGIAVDGARVAVVGVFRRAGDEPARQVALWDGSAWRALGGGADGHVLAVAFHAGEVVIGGELEAAGGARRLAAFDGEFWRPLGEMPSGPVFALGTHEGHLVAGGAFTRVGALGCARIARWSGGEWASIGTGFDAPVTAIGTWRGRLVAGGRFTRAGTIECRSIAVWTGERWEPIGPGLSGDANDTVRGVHALAEYGPLLVAGGRFDASGSTSISNLAAWDGARWSGFGHLDDIVYALSGHRGGVHVGGGFSSGGASHSAHLSELREVPSR